MNTKVQMTATVATVAASATVATVAAFAVAFDQLLTDLRTATEAVAASASDLKGERKAVTAIERKAWWQAWDRAMQAEPADRAALMEGFAAQVVEAGNKGDVYVYQQRARDSVTKHANAVRAESEAGKREKTTPVTIAKRLNEKGVTAAISEFANEEVRELALEIVAEKYGTDKRGVRNLIAKGDVYTVDAYALAKLDARIRLECLTQARALRDALGDIDAETLERIRAVFAH